ncbi:MAG: M20/M25/M40 family metallo-hydrolase [Cytophagales bacterium]|nr:M20/M25/M40 family metallo-hydrolase [Cytophagales bacterium]MDW8383522.1 M20/M25/M40 family metallo-hydrolase [Flammeovirgaceae bacterium]
MTKSTVFLFEYLNAPSPVGFEYTGQKIWLDYIKDFTDEQFTDIYGTAVGVINPNQSYKVVIEAHADEISWFVNYINDQGYIYLKRNGGSDPIIAPSKWVNIYTPKGIVKGVFGWPAIHVRDTSKDTLPTIENIFIDVGASSKKEVEEMGIHVGCVVTFEDRLRKLNKKYLTGRALDNRIGGFIIAEVARRLKKNNIKLPYTLYIVNSVQEEIGLRGAEMIVRRLKPDVAIITDVTHDTTAPMYNKQKDGEISCGKGPVLTYGPAVQNNVLNMIIKVAEERKISFQRATVSRTTGTDTDSFAYAHEGVASGLISLPLKYMHTTVETVAIEDIKQIIELMYQFLIQLPAGYDFRYIK